MAGPDLLRENPKAKVTYSSKNGELVVLYTDLSVNTFDQRNRLLTSAAEEYRFAPIYLTGATDQSFSA